MKALVRIRLVNWHLFENITIDCHGTTYFIGVNGAGKSTILDAVQFALVGGQRDVRFNQAAMAGGQRSLAGYVRGELGTEGRRFLRGDATAVVALEFANPDGSRFAHGAVVDAYEDNRRPDIAYFIVNDAALDDTWFFAKPGQVYSSRAFARHMKSAPLPRGAKAQVFARLEDYRYHLQNRLGQLRETFFDRLVKGVAFSPLTDIRAFVRSYLLDEKLVDVSNLQAQLETLRHFEHLVADVRDRIAALGAIEAIDQERLVSRRRRVANGFIHRYAVGDRDAARLKTLRIELDEARLGQSRAELARDDLGERLKHAQTALVDAQVALQSDLSAQREAALRGEIAALESEIQVLGSLRARTDAALAAEIADARRLQGMLAADGIEMPAGLTAIADAVPPGRHDDGWDGAVQPTPVDGSAQRSAADGSAQRSAADGAAQGAPGVGRSQGGRTSGPAPATLALAEIPATEIDAAAIAALAADLDGLGQGFARRAALCDEEARQLREEATQLEREIVQLRTGDQNVGYASEMPAATRLRQLIRAELGLPAEDVVFLCTVLSVPDEGWQDAVEGLLGASRFTLLVPPAHYRAAAELYRARRHGDRLHGVALLDVERILARTPGREPGTLAEEVAADPAHPAARAFVDLVLGRVVRCETLDDLRPHRSAITRECFARHNFTTRHLDPRVYRRWFIGERAIPRQIEQREARLEEIRAALLVLQVTADGLATRLRLSRDKLRGLLELEQALTRLGRLAELQTSAAALADELAALDVRSVAELRETAARRKVEVERLNEESARLERDYGKLEERVRNLSEEVIPDLASAVDAAHQAAEAFLVDEDATEAKADILADYARRRDRQSLEGVVDSTGRREGEHARAEARAREALSKAKQAYSLRYDFPDDEEEGALRYLAERQKFVDSELPAYEARAAEQRRLAEHELVENFIHRLREQIEDARQQLDQLNQTLSGLRFGGERFQFVTRPDPGLREIYAMIMDSGAVLGDSLFETPFRQRHQAGWDLLFDRLTTGLDAGPSTELRELQDYRNYLQYDIRIHYPGGDEALLSRISAKKSGGETTTPFYVAMAASFAQTYRLTQPGEADTIRLAIFDEAFVKMDTARTAAALGFMKETGLQVLLATPPDKAGALLAHIDSVRTVVRKDDHSFVLAIDKTEVEPAGVEEQISEGGHFRPEVAVTTGLNPEPMSVTT